MDGCGETHRIVRVRIERDVICAVICDAEPEPGSSASRTGEFAHGGDSGLGGEVEFFSAEFGQLFAGDGFDVGESTDAKGEEARRAGVAGADQKFMGC